MTFQKDAILTWASGDEFCRLPEFNVFLNSIKRMGFCGDTLFFTHDMPTDVRQKLFRDGFDVLDVEPEQVHMVVRDRFLAMYQFLAKNPGKYDLVLLTDSKDVLFQLDPFYYLTRSDFCLEDGFVGLCKEGGLHYQCEWNSGNQLRYQTNVKEFEDNFARWPIINSGFIIGTQEEIKNLCLLIWSNTLSTLTPISEQASLNYLARFLLEDENYVLIDPLETRLCATGEAIKKGWLEKEPVWKNGKLYNPIIDEPYTAFHQWERTHLKDEILESYL